MAPAFCQRMSSVHPVKEQGTILVTGACGHIGRAVCHLLGEAHFPVLPVDLDPGRTRHVRVCDLRRKDELAQLFRVYPIRAVIHLAGILPSAVQLDPLGASDINIGSSVELIRQSAAARVKRFIFASSLSVYGSSPRRQPLTETDPAAPDEPYGASKRAVELIGETFAKSGALEFVALRIARVVGPGIKKSSSPWRAQICERVSDHSPIHIPFSPDAMLSLVHVLDVARMLLTLVEAPRVSASVYNTPAEIWEARRLKEFIEQRRNVRIQLGPELAHGGPMSDGSRFAKEFAFQFRGLREYLREVSRSAG
jgi:nucleoside-diphosphate-sugar epimerase